jgi:uncharacterized protein (TIGR01777 family)
VNFVVSGGTGFIGRSLADELVRRGHGVTILTRQKNLSRAETGVSYVVWPPEAGPELVRAVGEADAVVNLAGESIAAQRWSPLRKEAILQSRTRSTRLLIQAMGKAKKRPECLLSASAIGFYGNRGNETLDEKSLMGLGFLAETCRRWEEEAREAEKLGVRTVLLRIGLVLGPGGGALGKMLGPFRLGLGGPIGSGEQWMSWIHVADLVRLVEWIAAQKSVSGPVNATAPRPVPMKEFARSLGKALRRPAFLPVPPFVLKLALGEMADMLITGQKVFPKKAIDAGFVFNFSDLKEALADIVEPKPVSA